MSLIERDGFKHVEQLALVFVDALDLHVEQRGRIDCDADALEDQSRQPRLVGALDRREALLEFGVVGEFLEFDRVVPASSKTPSPIVSASKSRQPRIGLEQPAAEA